MLPVTIALLPRDCPPSDTAQERRLRFFFFDALWSLPGAAASGRRGLGAAGGGGFGALRAPERGASGSRSARAASRASRSCC